jgi:hypothetical protein
VLEGAPRGEPLLLSACCSCASAASLGGEVRPSHAAAVADLELRGSGSRHLAAYVVGEATLASGAGPKRIAGRHLSRGTVVSIEVEAGDLPGFVIRAIVVTIPSVVVVAFLTSTMSGLVGLDGLGLLQLAWHGDEAELL